MTEPGDPKVSDALAVIVATRGRPAIVADLVARLSEQTRPPEAIFVIGASQADLAALPRAPWLEAEVGRAGLTRQRNDGLRRAGGRFAHVVFFDDDFVPSRFWLERAVGIFRDNPDIVSVTGAVLADGVKTAGVAPEQARRLVDSADAAAPSTRLHDGLGPYGCNMAFRFAAIADMAFDERLPLYGWLEDADFGGRLAPRGRLVRADALQGVHLGQKAGRARGAMLGYSQIANAFYLARKGSLSRRFVANLAIRNLLSNLARALRPEPFIDRRGRLYGNLRALKDVLRGRVEPERAAELQ